MRRSLLQVILACGLVRQVVSDAVDHPVPRLAPRQAASCAPWLSIYDSCTAATPGFSTMPISVEASCLCYKTGTWEPTVYDSAWATCLEYVATASPALYTSLGGAAITTDVCQAAGDVVVTGGGAARTTGTAQATGAASSRAGSLTDCNNFQSIENSCQQATPSFTALGFTQEASCLCYNDGTYDPSRFDNAIGGCLAYYSTASPAFYTSLGGDTLKRTPCASVGDIATGTSSASPTAAATTSTAQPTIHPITLSTTSTTSRTSKAAAMAITQPPMWPAAAGLGLLMLV